MEFEPIKEMVITEFRGNFPTNIPVRPGVDLEKLTEGDEAPFFLALEISSEGRVSNNGLIHDGEFGETLVQQIMSNATEGIMGHIKETDRESSYPVSDIHWIGAVRENGKTWAKGYIPKTAVAQREHYRILLATRGNAATSVYGQAVREFGNGNSWKAKNFKLEQLDLAPYNRAALPPESGFVVTAEMETNQQEEIQMDKLQVINEMTAEDARLLPKPVQEAILATVQPAPEVQLVSELRGALGADEKADVVKLVTELKWAREQAAKTAVTNRITELVTDKETGIKVESMRGMVTELVAAQRPQSVEDADKAYKTVTEMESVQAALKAAVQGAMGPKLTTPMQAQNGKAVDQWFPVKEEN